MPQAVIKLKQGFGRLIRTATDTGMVVLFDPRVLTKRYGRAFLDALPECKTFIDGRAGRSLLRDDVLDVGAQRTRTMLPSPWWFFSSFSIFSRAA